MANIGWKGLAQCTVKANAAVSPEKFKANVASKAMNIVSRRWVEVFDCMMFISQACSTAAAGNTVKIRKLG
jgi:hypothetical protein